MQIFNLYCIRIYCRILTSIFIIIVLTLTQQFTLFLLLPQPQFRNSNIQNQTILIELLICLSKYFGHIYIHLLYSTSINYLADDEGSTPISSTAPQNPTIENLNMNSLEQSYSLTPLSISMILSATKQADKSFMIDNTALKDVYTIGFVDFVMSTEAYTLYKIRDGYRKVLFKKYNYTVEPWEQFVIEHRSSNFYVMVIGRIQKDQEDNYIVALNTRRITDLNEITFTNLQIIEAFLFRTRGPLRNNLFAEQRQINQQKQQQLEQLKQQKQVAHDRYQQAKDENRLFGSQDYLNVIKPPYLKYQQMLPDIEKQPQPSNEYRYGLTVETGKFGLVLNECLKVFQDTKMTLTDGLTVQFLFSQFNERYNQVDLQNAITRLYMDGRILTVNDQNHFIYN